MSSTKILDKNEILPSFPPSPAFDRLPLMSYEFSAKKNLIDLFLI